MDARIVDNLPPVIRGAGSEQTKQRQQIAEWLTDGEAHMITGIADRKAHNRLQQKIRNIAKNKGINVTVRYYPESGETGFQGMKSTDVVTATAKKVNRKSTDHSE